jgi:hypothetical protein
MVVFIKAPQLEQWKVQVCDLSTRDGISIFQMTSEDPPSEEKALFALQLAVNSDELIDAIIKGKFE